MAHTLFRGRVRVGYIAAIVAASNAGGSGSVIGDTTTTMMWISGVSPPRCSHAYVAAAVALFVFGIPAARQQHASRRSSGRRARARSRLGARRDRRHHPGERRRGERGRERSHPEHAGRVSRSSACAVCARHRADGAWRRPDWASCPGAVKGSLFPAVPRRVGLADARGERCPAPSWQSALALGFVSAFFDNIPLTALALKQGGYDWGVLAYAVGFGGSMIWFGSSAGVAISSMFPEARSTGRGCARAGPSRSRTS